MFTHVLRAVGTMFAEPVLIPTIAPSARMRSSRRRSSSLRSGMAGDGIRSVSDRFDDRSARRIQLLLPSDT